MSAIHAAAIVLTLLLYGVQSFAYFGWGRAAKFVLAWAIREPDAETVSQEPITRSIWIGWAISLFLFGLIHFFYPLTFYTVIPVLILGIIFSGLAIRRSRNQILKLRLPTFSISQIIAFFIVSIIALQAGTWFISRTMVAPQISDSGLYHFQVIRWINSAPVVPGLGNLHGRLAFNQSFFAYVVALNFYPFFQKC